MRKYVEQAERIEMLEQKNNELENSVNNLRAMNEKLIQRMKEMSLN